MTRWTRTDGACRKIARQHGLASQSGLISSESIDSIELECRWRGRDRSVELPLEMSLTLVAGPHDAGICEEASSSRPTVRLPANAEVEDEGALGAAAVDLCLHLRGPELSLAPFSGEPDWFDGKRQDPGNWQRIGEPLRERRLFQLGDVRVRRRVAERAVTVTCPEQGHRLGEVLALIGVDV